MPYTFAQATLSKDASSLPIPFREQSDGSTHEEDSGTRTSILFGPDGERQGQ